MYQAHHQNVADVCLSLQFITFKIGDVINTQVFTVII